MVTEQLRKGDRVTVVGPTGQEYRLRVLRTTATHLTGAVVAPRRLRSNVVTIRYPHQQ